MRALTGRVRSRRRLWSVLMAGVVLPLLLTPAAGAGPTDPPGGRGDDRSTPSSSYTTGGSGGGNIAAGVHTRIVVSGGKGSGGSGTSAGADIRPDGNWTPPACWWEPTWTPEELKTVGDALDGLLGILGVPGQPFHAMYGDYNVGKDGRWWAPVKNPDRQGDPATEACAGVFWADATTTPKVPMAVSPEVMAKYAYKQLPLPRLAADLNPSGGQTVNLATWIWTTGAVFRPVSVRASLPGTGLWAVTTATPVALHLDAGTPDADLLPVSGDCPINADGTIGQKYTPGDRSDPPCGVVYRRMTAPDATFPLQATITWKVSWKGSDGGGGRLPNGTLRDEHDVQVREIQSVVRPQSG